MDSPYTVYGTNFYTYELTAGWNYDARNRALFADRGLHLGVSGRYALPLSDVRYYADQLPVPAVRADVAEMAAVRSMLRSTTPRRWASTTSLPPYLNYFAGGPDSIRGYRESRLGPRDNIGIGNPYGGQFSRRQSPGADIPGAGQVEERGPGELVLRHGQRVSDRQ